MRILTVGLLTALLALAFAVSADAETTKKKKKHTAASGRTVSRSAERPDLSRPEDLPFGSSAWWQAMDREGRGGQNLP
jgi:hypothetical protein